MGIDRNLFLKNFNSDEMKRKTVQGFEFSRQLGVKGFPTLLTLENGAVKIISHGFQSLETLKPVIDSYLKTVITAEAAYGQSCDDTCCGC